MEKVRYMISDAAGRVQVEAHVLRYWEEELELDVPRNEMGHRYYTEENLRQFEEIKRLKEEGYQLKAIRMMIHNPHIEELQMDDERDEKTEEDGNVYTENPQEKDAYFVEKTTDSAQPPVSSDVSLSKLERFRIMMNEIVRNAIAENNQALGNEVSSQVGEKVLKEMNYLMRDREEQEEERFRKLDEAIRSRQGRSRRDREAKRKEKSGKFRLRTRESIS